MKIKRLLAQLLLFPTIMLFGVIPAGGAAGGADGGDEANPDSDKNDDADTTGTLDTSGDGKNKGKSGAEEEEKPAKTFTQEQVNKMMAKEKSQGRIAALNELGVNPKDAASLAKVKEFIESQKTDDQKIQEKRLEEQAALNEANKRAVIAEAKAEAMVLGAKSQYVDDLVTLALSKVSEDSDMKTLLGELKIKYPVWFESANDNDPKDKGKKGTGSTVGGAGSKKDGKENSGLGARLAAQRKGGNTAKKSYWGN